MIALACDHAAVELKNKIALFLQKKGYDIKDFGCHDTTSVDYPDYAAAAARSVSCGECEKGILICGTGIGMSIAANKIKGIRCALCGDVFSARATRMHNDANMLALGARVIGEGLAEYIVETFLTTPFSGEERHRRRIDKISELEK